MRAHGRSAEIRGISIHVHLIGVCGTGMGAFAGLLKEAGHRVTGSDTAFYPPMGEALARWGIEKREGYSAEHLDPRPDMVVVGNVCRRDNPEAQAALQAEMNVTSFPAALARMFLKARVPFVVTGTHGKTTTSAMLAFLLDRVGRDPGFLVGGILADFPESFRAGPEGGPFVIEGDEYDSAFFEKSPKFWQYLPKVACIHAIEHDHIDIYPDMDSYRDAFVRFVELMPTDGLLVINAADPEVRTVATAARCRVLDFAIEGEDTGERAPALLARLQAPTSDGQPFELLVADQVDQPGSGTGAKVEALCPLSGSHNVKNALAALAMASHGAGVPLEALANALPHFTGIRRRQELRGTAGGVRIYDDFAHHPTAVAETLPALRARHPEGRLVAIFEPRSATASRNIHQARYPAAFASADLSLLAPVGRKEIAEAERLDVHAIAAAIRAAGGEADTPADVHGIVARVADYAREGDTVVVMSNGAFGGIHELLLARLAG